MAILNGTSGDDHIEGTSSDDTIRGFEGNDTLDGQNGEDNLYGGAGNDLLIGDDDEDDFTGDEGSDIFYGVSGDLESDTPDFARYDREVGGTQGAVVNLATGIATDSFGFSDFLYDIEAVWGTRFADSLTGGNVFNDGFEAFQGLEGNDTINGGSGYDRADYYSDFFFGGGLGIVADLVAGTVIDGFGDTDSVSGIEEVRGTSFADSVLGNNGDNILIGLAGNDTFNGGRGSDWMYYFRDDDRRDASGNFGLSGVTVNLATGVATDGYGDADQLISVENIDATVFDDNVTGSKSDNILYLGDGADTADGGKGNDTIGSGSGHDVLSGGAGNDVLYGFRGRDTVSGGAGADEFYFSSVTNSGDRITDFASADDQLTFDSRDSLFLKPVGHTLTLGVDFFLSTTSGGATSGTAAFIYETDAGRLWFDYDGNGAVSPILMATLSGAPTITAADFAFVDGSLYFD